MRRVEWDPALNTGDPTVDTQHQELVALFNEMAAAQDAGDRREVLSALQRLSDYVLMHFSAEESLMANHEYPAEDAHRHIAEHRALTEQTRALVLAYRSGEYASVMPIVDFLAEWLAHHVEESDRRFVDYVRDIA